MAEQALSNSRTKSRRSRGSGSDEPSLNREIVGILLIALSVLLLLSFVTYKTGTALKPEATNWIGPVGAFIAENFYFTFGVGAYAFVLLTAVSATSLLFGHKIVQSVGHALGSLLLLLTASGLCTTLWANAEVYGVPIGGQLGEFISSTVSGLFGRPGAIVILSTLLIISLMLVTRTSVVELMQAISDRMGGRSDDGPIRAFLGAIASFFRGVMDGAREWFSDVRQRRQVRREERRAAREEKKAEREAKKAEKKKAKEEKRKKKEAVRSEDVDADEGEDRQPVGVIEGDADEDAGTVRIPVQESPQSPLEDAMSDLEDSAPKRREIENPMRTPTRPVQPADDTPTSRIDSDHESADGGQDGPNIIESEAQLNRKSADDIERDAIELMKSEERDDSWEFPPLKFLNYEEPSGTSVDKDGLREIAERLEQVLEDFKVKGNVTNICPGPVVTRYEFEPEPGTKLRKISNLSDDIAMALCAEKVRIIAPIPGKGCVGFEVPNEDRETVYLKEVLGSQKFSDAKSKITLALGKDIEGFPIVANLAKMPHLLVAGTTGSGKSVSVNSMIASMLYNASPDDVRMILIDPKQLEFAVYEDVPHLLLPVVTDPSKAATALQWAVTEMERRYKLMKELRVRNIDGYNSKLKRMQEEYEEEISKGNVPSQKLADLLTEVDDDDRPRHRHMPYLVVVVDEFADLMMVAGKDVEQAVARLAQKARAAGIHCILATQRPSVDVLTGLIKANFPTRISFRLMSGTDSRTVLDTSGAENLLGMGDMLFRPPGTSELTRVHGAFVDEDEIDQIVDFLKEQGKADYDESILNPPVEDMIPDEEVDEKYDAAVHCVVEAGYASISMVQRKLRVGYNRAARMVEHMEREGVIGPPTGGSSRRDVLVDSIPDD
jgi:S-DNA-T family DNA segregation ATPase FtsK/SpoIIIE